MKKGITIIIPVLNEAGTVDSLISRLKATLESSAEAYELLFIDDHSTDTTTQILKTYSSTDSTIRHYMKQGQPGKSFSILEGIDQATFDTVGMIDADLQYAPENIGPMLEIMRRTQSDIVITRRKVNETSPLRRLMSTVFNLVFTRMMFGIDYDTQSGLKIFKADVFKTLDLSPTPWGFDLEFIVFSLLQGNSIASYDITFEARTEGEAKINVISSSFELAKQSVQLRAKISGSQLRRSYVNNSARFKTETGVSS
ncbi:MAG: glycosyltransferase family 2 protein [Chloroflexi bacterium]|nr:MAG: glycosyltransferase family 2 protein [Chloroflexota bacterium]